MDEAPPIERTTTFATTVDDLAAAWAFIMGRIEEVGPDPRITISPIWSFSASSLDVEQNPPRRFEVSVSGMVHDVAGVSS